jgi:hypothetical protein
MGKLLLRSQIKINACKDQSREDGQLKIAQVSSDRSEASARLGRHDLWGCKQINRYSVKEPAVGIKKQRNKRHKNESTRTSNTRRKKKT